MNLFSRDFRERAHREARRHRDICAVVGCYEPPAAGEMCKGHECQARIGMLGEAFILALFCWTVGRALWEAVR